MYATSVTIHLTELEKEDLESTYHLLLALTSVSTSSAFTVLFKVGFSVVR